MSERIKALPRRMIPVMIGLWVVAPIIYEVLSLIPILRPVAFDIGGVCGFATIICIVLVSRKALEKKALSLAESANVSDVGPLAEVLWIDYGNIMRPTVAVGLTRLLPLLTATDASLLTKYQRSCLYKILKMTNYRRFTYPDPDLIVAVLKATKQIKDVTILPEIKRLALEEALLPSDQCIRATAQECLHALEAAG